MKVSAVIPAYNEELTVAKVVEVCKASSLIDEIIVVDDGSKDQTSLLAENAGARVIRYEENRGKAYVVLAGAKEAKNEIILLLDADLTNLNVKHIELLILPVLQGSVQATIGLFTKGRMKTDLAHTLSPGLSGQRCLHRDFLLKMANIENVRYAFEICLNNWMKKNQIMIQKIPLEGVSHLTKEEKRGSRRGFSNRMGMYEDIMSSLFKKKDP